jgi:hypothetical protein
MKLPNICEIHQLCQPLENSRRRYNSGLRILKIRILK